MSTKRPYDTIQIGMSLKTEAGEGHYFLRKLVLLIRNNSIKNKQTNKNNGIMVSLVCAIRNMYKDHSISVCLPTLAEKMTSNSAVLKTSRTTDL